MLQGNGEASSVSYQHVANLTLLKDFERTLCPGDEKMQVPLASTAAYSHGSSDLQLLSVALLFMAVHGVSKQAVDAAHAYHQRIELADSGGASSKSTSGYGPSGCLWGYMVQRCLSHVLWYLEMQCICYTCGHSA